MNCIDYISNSLYKHVAYQSTTLCICFQYTSIKYNYHILQVEAYCLPYTTSIEALHLMDACVCPRLQNNNQDVSSIVFLD